MTQRLPEPRAAVADIALARPDWTRSSARNPSMLWLDKNENTDPALGELVAEIMRTLPSEAYWTYPDTAPLYAKLAASIGCTPANLLLAAGSDGVIRAVFEAYVSEGDTVIHTAPTFAMYPVYCRMYGARAVAAAYEPSADGPRLDVERLCRLIRDEHPKLVCLPNPDSPTGTVFAADALDAIITEAGRAGALMLVDEAYWPFWDATCAGWIDRHPHLVVARSTGKAWGCAGLRIGWAVAAPGVAQMLHKVRPMYEVNTVAVHAFERLLEHEDSMRASVARLEAGKRVFLAAMAALGLRTLPSAGSFVHVAFGANAEAVHAALADLVYYRRDFNDACLRGFSRFSCTTPELFGPVIARIRQAVSEEIP